MDTNKPLRKVPSKQLAAVSAKINAIRLAAGNPGTHCPTCARRACDPYARVDTHGYTTEGCVDAFHSTGGLIGERARWHARPEAHAIRKAELAVLEAF
jgi:hypothetical protein